VRVLAIAFLLAACGPKHAAPPPDDDDDLSELEPPLEQPAVCTANSPDRWTEDVEPPAGATEIEVRQQTACNSVMPKLTACAVEDACTKLEPGKVHELDLENTAPIHARELLKTCKATPMSSRQVRVYEVCFAQEPECGPLAACLENARAATAE